MPLTNVAEVEKIGALIPNLFDTDQAGLDALVLDAATDADNWMQVYLGSLYGGTTTAETAVQARGQAYLALAYLTPTLKAKKVYGTHFPLDSEDSAAYENLLEQDWEGLARSLLAKWISIEATGTGGGAQQNFALPYFAAVDSPDATTTDDNDLQLRELADAARSRPEVDFSTVT
jgi:hypothetical protein